MARGQKAAPRLPVEAPDPEERRELAEGYAAVLRVLYAKPWDGMTPESIAADADAFEADFDNFPEEKRRSYAGAIEDARRYLGFARRAAARGDIGGAWEWMCSVVHTRRFLRGETR